jgi:hypothetical protein
VSGESCGCLLIGVLENEGADAMVFGLESIEVLVLMMDQLLARFRTGSNFASSACP